MSRAGERLLFNDGENAECVASGDRYRLFAGGVSLLS